MSHFVEIKIVKTIINICEFKFVTNIYALWKIFNIFYPGFLIDLE